MKFDGNKPTPQTYEDALEIIDVLLGAIADLQESNKALAAKVADLEEKLKTNSNNSSKPPSSDLFKNKKNKQHGLGKNKRSKQGAQPGHRGKGRKLLPPEKVDHTLVLVYSSQGKCRFCLCHGRCVGSLSTVIY